MTRVLEVPYGQIGDMTKKYAMNLDVLKVDTVGTAIANHGWKEAKAMGMLATTTAPHAAEKNRTLNPQKYSDPAASRHYARDTSVARWQIIPLPRDLTLDQVLQRGVKVNEEVGKSPLLKVKVKFSDASEITFLRHNAESPSTLKYAGFYAPVPPGPVPVHQLPSINAASSLKGGLTFQSASAAFTKCAPAVPALSENVEMPSREVRKMLFNRLDFNGNGMLSLAELDKAVIELWPAFNNKPAIMRAYKASDVNGSGFISRGEFDHFIRYLVNFNTVWKTFSTADTNQDQRVSLPEFLAAAKTLEPTKTDDVLTAMFKKIDKNGGGYILFAEFCDAIVKNRTNVIGYVPAIPIQKMAKTAPAKARAKAIATKKVRMPPLEIPSGAKLKALFSQLDPNGNGLLSLAELDKAVIELWPAFNNKPAIMRAYKAADANGTGFVGRAEFEFFLRYLVHFTNLWVAFQDTDTSGDRRVSLQEFLAARERLQVGTEVEARSAFAEMDRNRGGVVLFEEFCDWMAKNKAKYEVRFSQPLPSITKKQPLPPPKPVATHDLSGASLLPLVPGAKLKELFNRLDPNGNGMLSLAELDKAVIELWPAFNNKPAIMRAYKAADKNKTGFVSKSEFAFFMHYLVHYNNLWRAFADVDTSRDRKLSKAEFLAGAEKLRLSSSKDDLSTLFDSLDTNKGGSVLFNEFCEGLSSMLAQAAPAIA